MNKKIALHQTSLESVVTPMPKSVINWYLSTIAPDVVVVGSRITEDGWELVLEGKPVQMTELIYALAEGVK